MGRLSVFLINTLCILLVGTASSYAYLLKPRFILDRVAKNDGRGVYQIELEVQFPQDSDSLTTRETWRVQDGETMQVAVRVMNSVGSAAKPLAILYREGNRFVAEAGSAPRSARMGSELIEPLMHFRSVDSLGHFLVSNRLLNPSALVEHRIYSLKNLKHETDSRVMLARESGVITFALGVQQAAQWQPMVWIDQERFVLKKVKLPTGVEILNDNPEPFAKGLMFPKDRVVTWNGKRAQIRTLSVKSLGDGRAKPLIAGSVQGLASDEKIFGSLPPSATVREFYSRFR